MNRTDTRLIDKPTDIVTHTIIAGRECLAHSRSQIPRHLIPMLSACAVRIYYLAFHGCRSTVYWPGR